jgi:3-oxoacyl-[acyl-carrier-protein] synthase II
MKISLIKKEFSTKRVVVTGMGMVAPLGNNCKENWESLVNLKSGIKSLENEDFSNDLPKNCKIGAPICKNFDSKKFRTLGTDNLLTQITMSAAEEAIRDSNLTFNNKIIKYRTV